MRPHRHTQPGRQCRQDGGGTRNIHAQRELYARLELQNRTLEQQVAQRTAELERLNQALQFQVEENRRLAETDS